LIPLLRKAYSVVLSINAKSVLPSPLKSPFIKYGIVPGFGWPNELLNAAALVIGVNVPAVPPVSQLTAVAGKQDPSAAHAVTEMISLARVDRLC
jgi:hypothetical protein